ncbi:Aste57867_12387 [Aphanomyces stellatus]|uniref:Microsomal glutathione S-transferase 1 n=1 Tax=Aphanomyces stellatus TaxID=120398 RepID=A0A485KW19_9STRA|nr:hypothetical protein As57867_012341 [Aphanomyces stellatus]VFT89238.1 Aste57867_12387 [Aphanomyces stellatus]
MTNSLPLQTVMVCTAVLFLKHFVTGLLGAKAKFAAGTRAPEDAADGKQNFGVAPSHASDVEPNATKITEMRWNRITMNDLENIPLGLIVAWAAVACGGDATTVAVATIVFTIARIGHTVAYARALSQARGLAYIVGSVAIFVLAGAGISGAFRSTI